MRRLIVMVLLAGAFFGGYQTGRRPGSPDLVPIARDAYNQSADICGRLIVLGQDAAKHVGDKIPAAKELALGHTDNTDRSVSKGPTNR